MHLRDKGKVGGVVRLAGHNSNSRDFVFFILKNKLTEILGNNNV